MSALEESGLSLTGSKQEQYVLADWDGKGSKFDFRLLTLMN